MRREKKLLCFIGGRDERVCGAGGARNFFLVYEVLFSRGGLCYVYGR